MSSHNANTHAGHEEHAHGGPAVYTGTLIGLLVLTAITVAASYVNFGEANVVIALFIATCKAILVSLFFMHLRWDKSTNAIIAVSGFLFLGIFITFDLLDLNNRRDATPRNIPVMTDKDGLTPVPDTMNPLKTPAPVPEVVKPKPVEGEGHEGAHKE